MSTVYTETGHMCKPLYFKQANADGCENVWCSSVTSHTETKAQLDARKPFCIIPYWVRLGPHDAGLCNFAMSETQWSQS